MSSSDGESIFLTQSKFKDDNENHPNTDGVLSDILDMEAGPDFDLIQNCVFSDISDEDMINASQEVESIDRFLKPLNQQDLDDLIRSGLSKKTESKSKWALNLFASWQQERKKKQPNTDVYMYKNIMNMQDDEIDKCLSYKTQDAQLVKVSEIIHGKENPLKEEDENKENVKKLRTEEDSKRECGPREIHIEQGNISFKFKF